MVSIGDRFVVYRRRNYNLDHLHHNSDAVAGLGPDHKPAAAVVFVAAAVVDSSKHNVPEVDVHTFHPAAPVASFHSVEAVQEFLHQQHPDQTLTTAH